MKDVFKEKQFEIITRYIPRLRNLRFGDWIFDYENDGSPEHPIQWPLVSYSDVVNRFIEDVYALEEVNPDLKLNQYGEILNKNGLEWSSKSMKNADAKVLDAQCLSALLMGIIRADRFNDGVLLEFFRTGKILEWLEMIEAHDV